MGFWETLQVFVFRLLNKPQVETNDISKELFTKLYSVFSNPLFLVVFGTIALIAVIIVIARINK